MTCPACAAAEVKPRTDAFVRGCVSCEARSLAAIGGGPDAFSRVWPDPQRREQGREQFNHWAGVLRRDRASRRE